MKNFNKILVLMTFMFSVTYLNSQNLTNTLIENVRLEILNELPFLDVEEEAKYYDGEKEVMKNTIMSSEENFMLEILNELPSLDTHDEAKYYNSEKEVLTNASEMDDQSFRLEVLSELPYLDTHGEAKYLND